MNPKVQIYDVGKCYVMTSDDPFSVPLYMKVIDKKDGYVKYLLSGKYPTSASERYLTGLYKEVECSKLLKNNKETTDGK